MKAKLKRTKPTQNVLEKEKCLKVYDIVNKGEHGKYLYLYGIVKKENIEFERGLKDEPIKKIEFKDIIALVSDYPTLHPPLQEKEAMQHTEILKRIAEKTTVIPLAFGTVFKDREILEGVLSKAYQAIKETQRAIEGKIELGVKVVKKNREKEYNGTGEEILKSLDELGVEKMKGDIFSDLLLLNYSFLVKKERFDEFSDKIAELENKHTDLKFLYTGPWPPYSFVKIRIGGN